MGTIQSGDSAWVLVCAALVMFMTPGLALLYAGLVRARFALSAMFMSTAALAVVGLTWFVAGYSLAFAPSSLGFIGGLQWMFFQGVGMAPSAYAPTIPHSAFALFQGMAAIITPAVISGSLVERLRLKPWLLFLVAWTLLVYAPLAHMIWADDGLLKSRGVLDYSGGYVIHIALAFSALVFTTRLGPRKTFGREDDAPHNIFMAVAGAVILWFGWLGFNGGCAGAANGLASQAVVNTFLSSAAGFVAWAAAEFRARGKPTTLGPLIGAIAGLVAIGAGAPFVSATASLAFGVAASLGCFYAAGFVKKTLKIDDTLDVFACHGVGGVIGVVFTGILADPAALKLGGYTQSPVVLLKAEILAIIPVAAYAALGTYVIVRALEMMMPLRTALNDEGADDDMSEMGETLVETAAAPAPAAVPDPEQQAWITFNSHPYLAVTQIKEWIADGAHVAELSGLVASAQRKNSLAIFSFLAPAERDAIAKLPAHLPSGDSVLRAIQELRREVLHAASLKPAWFSALPLLPLAALSDANLDAALLGLPPRMTALAFFAIPSARMNRLHSTLVRADIDQVIAHLQEFNAVDRDTAMGVAQSLAAFLAAGAQATRKAG